MGFEVKLFLTPFSCADAWGSSTPPLRPPENCKCGGGRDEGVAGIRGLARDGTRWPSGARPTQPSQTVQVAGVNPARLYTREGGELRGYGR